MSSDDSKSTKSKLTDPSRLNAADAKIIFWIIIITIIFTIFLIFYFAIKPDHQPDPPPAESKTENVITERETWFCPFYDNHIGFWDWLLFSNPYNWRCAVLKEGTCLNYDGEDPEQPEEEEDFVDEREDSGLCPSYIRVSFPISEETKEKYWNKTFLGEFLMRTMYKDGQMYGYVCEDDVEFVKKCDAEEEPIDIDELFADCSCANGCGWTDVDAFTELEIQQKSTNDDTWANTLWKHSEIPADEIVQVSGCSLLAVVNACHMLEVEATVKDTADWTYNIARFEGDADWNKTEEMIDHYNLKKVPLFDNNEPKHFTSAPTAKDDDEKIQYVKQALASGYAVIASGKRGDESCEENTGTCTFTGGGHFVTIVAAYEDNTFTVANAMVSRSGTNGWRMNAYDVVKFMKVAVAVGKEDAGELINCSASQTEPEDPPATEPETITIRATVGDINTRKKKTKHGDICGRKVDQYETIEVLNKIEEDESEENDPKKCQKGWYKIVDKKKNYWKNCYVCADYFEKYDEPEVDPNKKKTMYVNDSKGINIREGHAANTNLIDRVKCGYSFEVYEQLFNVGDSRCEKGWMKIASGKFADRYVCSNFLGNSAPSNETCNPSSGEEGEGGEEGENPPSGPVITSGKTGKELLLECEKTANGKTKWGNSKCTIEYNYSNHKFYWPKERATSNADTPENQINPIFHCLVKAFRDAAVKNGYSLDISATSVRKYNDQATNWNNNCKKGTVACPGGSAHGWGLAIDLKYNGGKTDWRSANWSGDCVFKGKTVEGCKWAKANASKYNLTFRLDGKSGRPHEDWHVEPSNVNTKDPKYKSGCKAPCP